MLSGDASQALWPRQGSPCDHSPFQPSPCFCAEWGRTQARWPRKDPSGNKWQPEVAFSAREACLEPRVWDGTGEGEGVSCKALNGAVATAFSSAPPALDVAEVCASVI